MPFYRTEKHYPSEFSIIKRKSIDNLRTLGGIKNTDGQTIRFNILYRSALVDHISDADAAFLRDDLKVKTIIDLRTEDEEAKKPDKPIEGVAYRYMPVCRDAIPGVSREVEPGKEPPGGLKADMLPVMTDIYSELVADEECIEHVGETLRVIMENRDGAMLWHCTAGKDRCGFVSALILHMLGVDKETIIEDYLLTNLDAKRHAVKYWLLIRIFKRDKELAKKVYDAYIADRSFIEAALGRIERDFGGLDTYIREQMGISDEEIRAFREYALM